MSGQRIQIRVADSLIPTKMGIALIQRSPAKKIRIIITDILSEGSAQGVITEESDDLDYVVIDPAFQTSDFFTLVT